MPIKGLSETRRITRGGYIRLGEMKTNAKGKDYPSKSDHFIADFEDKQLETDFYQIYGDNPTRITVAFPSNDPEVIFPQYYKAYGASSGIKCKGDGETAYRYATGETVPCPGPDNCEYGQLNQCRPVASLMVFVRGLNVLQVFQINTGSRNSIINLNSGIDLLRLARGNKSIAGVWVDLELKPQEAQADGKKVSIYVMSLVIPVGLDDVRQLESAFAAPAQLPGPDETRDALISQPVSVDAQTSGESPPTPQTAAAEPVPSSPPPAPPPPQESDKARRAKAFSAACDLAKPWGGVDYVTKHLAAMDYQNLNQVPVEYIENWLEDIRARRTKEEQGKGEQTEIDDVVL